MFRHFDVARPIDAPVEFAEYGAQLLHKGLDGQSPFDEPSELLLCDCIQAIAFDHQRRQMGRIAGKYRFDAPPDGRIDISDLLQIARCHFNKQR